MDNTPQRLFVYSSLRSGFQHPAYAYISKYFTLEAEATVKGKLFDLGKNIIGVPSNDELFIKGELYIIKEPTELSWAIAQLDDYEGVADQEDGPPFYARSINTVYIGEREEKAWVYWYCRDITGSKFIESGDMLVYLQQNK